MCFTTIIFCLNVLCIMIIFWVGWECHKIYAFINGIMWLLRERKRYLSTILWRCYKIFQLKIIKCLLYVKILFTFAKKALFYNMSHCKNWSVCLDNDSAVFVQTTNNNFVVNVDVKKIVKLVYLFEGISYIPKDHKNVYVCTTFI